MAELLLFFDEEKLPEIKVKLVDGLLKFQKKMRILTFFSEILSVVLDKSWDWFTFCDAGFIKYFMDVSSISQIREKKLTDIVYYIHLATIQIPDKWSVSV